MPWPPKQARAIAMRYEKEGKKIPPSVAKDLSSSLKGKHMPPKTKKKRHKRRAKPPTKGT
jgi:hypothetical protein